MATQAQLDEARAAYHDLMTGVNAAKVRYADGREVAFNTATANQLLSYVNSLEAQLGVPPMQRTGPRRTPSRRVVW